MHIDPTFSPTIKRLAQLFAFFVGISTAQAEKTNPTILFLGDSITAGYGLEKEQAYPALIQAQLKDEGYEATIINGGLSGETTAGGLRRLRWVMQRPIDILVVALGGNDGLRGLEVEDVEENLKKIIRTAREIQPDIKILLSGMYAPPNMGADYRQAFDEVYPRLAKEEAISLLPFILQDVAGVRELNQADGIHPNPEGQRTIAANMLKSLYPLIREL